VSGCAVRDVGPRYSAQIHPRDSHVSGRILRIHFWSRLHDLCLQISRDNVGYKPSYLEGGIRESGLLQAEECHCACRVQSCWEHAWWKSTNYLASQPHFSPRSKLSRRLSLNHRLNLRPFPKPAPDTRLHSTVAADPFQLSQYLYRRISLAASACERGEGFAHLLWSFNSWSELARSISFAWIMRIATGLRVSI